MRGVLRKSTPLTPKEKIPTLCQKYKMISYQFFLINLKRVLFCLSEIWTLPSTSISKISSTKELVAEAMEDLAASSWIIISGSGLSAVSISDMPRI